MPPGCAWCWFLRTDYQFPLIVLLVQTLREVECGRAATQRAGKPRDVGGVGATNKVPLQGINGQTSPFVQHLLYKVNTSSVAMRV